MSRVLFVVNKIFAKIITGSYGLKFFIDFILANQYLLVGIVLTIVGFSVGIIYRIIHS